MSVACWYCGREFGTKKALNAHLQFCGERKKKRDRWVRYRVGRATIGVISRSKRPIAILNEQHRLYTDRRLSKGAFIGIVEGMRLMDVIEVQVEGSV